MKNQRGQAVLEYILLMIVIMVTVVSIFMAFSRSTQEFISNYWGAYFQCLLETGELPTLGSDDNSTAECDESFQPFTLAAGRPPINNNANADSGSGSDGNGNNSNNNSDNPGDVASSSAGGGGGSPSSTSGNFDENFAKNNKQVPLTQADINAGAKDNGGGRPGFYNFGQNGNDDDNGNGRSEFVPAGGIYAKMKDEDGKKPVVAVKTDGDKTADGAPRRVPANLDRKPPAQVEADTGMTLPDFFKYLLIIGIILALVIFFGNQVMNFQKSQSD
jgi:hypothetical protein